MLSVQLFDLLLELAFEVDFVLVVLNELVDGDQDFSLALVKGELFRASLLLPLGLSTLLELRALLLPHNPRELLEEVVDHRAVAIEDPVLHGYLLLLHSLVNSEVVPEHEAQLESRPVDTLLDHIFGPPTNRGDVLHENLRSLPDFDGLVVLLRPHMGLTLLAMGHLGGLRCRQRGGKFTRDLVLRFNFFEI